MGAVTFRGSSGSLRGVVARLPLLCNVTVECRGRLSLRSRSGTRIGASGFRIRAGARESVGVNLNKAGRRLVRGKRRVKVRARAAIRGVRPSSRQMTVRR